MQHKNNKIRHQVLKILIDNAYEMEVKYGSPYLEPMDKHLFEIEKSDIMEKLNITYRELEEASTRAYSDKAYKTVYIDQDHSTESMILGENGRIFYNEKTYQREGQYFFHKEDFWKAIILGLIATIISVVINYFVKDSQGKDIKARQAKTDSLTTVIKTLKK